MNFEPSRAKALDQLERFVENNLVEYSKLRNFDFGPEKRSNVSCLSPYITHGIVNEQEIIKKSLSKFSFSKNEKFIQEVLWRTYWKGWLELRPSVWSDYLAELIKIKENLKNNQNYKNAIEGKTKIDCFNQWVIELKENNYLHNHTRMWFASIWIFTLKLPWELGANLFMKYLYDGDAASNTLSWRWVAGLQTAGKHYVATSQNIFKYTKQRFKPLNLNEEAKPIHNDKFYNIEELKMFNNNKLNNSLIIFDNNLDSKNNKKLTDKYKNIYILSLDNDSRKIKLCQEVLSFKNSLINDYSNTMTNSKVVSSSELLSVIEMEPSIDVLYPGIGENLSFVKKSSSTTIVNYIYDEKDISCWKFSKKGFFNFKKNIPDILEKLLIIEDF